MYNEKVAKGVCNVLQVLRTVKAALTPLQSCPRSWTTSWLLQTSACWRPSTCAQACLMTMTTRHPGNPCACRIQWTCQQALTAGPQLQLPQPAPAMAPDQSRHGKGRCTMRSQACVAGSLSHPSSALTAGRPPAALQCRQRALRKGTSSGSWTHRDPRRAPASMREIWSSCPEASA